MVKWYCTPQKKTLERNMKYSWKATFVWWLLAHWISKGLIIKTLYVMYAASFTRYYTNNDKDRTNTAEMLGSQSKIDCK